MNMIVSFTKTWRGNEFAIPSLESVYPYVDKMVYLHSDISWDGTRGNSVRPLVKLWKGRHDNQDKIINIDLNTRSQTEQYEAGIEYIKNNFPEADYMLLLDTDEVWDDKDLVCLFERANCLPEAWAFCVNMYTYIKSPFYRVDPVEPCKPVVLYKLNSNGFKGLRGCEIGSQRVFLDLYFHHFAYVRENEDELFLKIKQTYETEKEAYRHVDLDKWKREKWDKLPYAENLHTEERHSFYWQRVIEIKLNDLPEVVRNNYLVQKRIKL